MNKYLNRKTISRCRVEESPLAAEDTVNVRHRGQIYSIPRWEYERPLTQQEVDQSNHVESGELFRLISVDESVPRSKSSAKEEMPADITKASSSSHISWKTHPQRARNNLDDDLQFLKQLEDNFRQTMSQSSSAPEATSSDKKNEEQDLNSMENIFTLEDLTESKETVVEQPIARDSSHHNVSRSDISKAPRSLGAPSAESLKMRKQEEVTVKLFQLKSKVVNLIDQTISQIESNEDTATSESIPLHPGGDGSTLDHRSRNLQVLKTDSFARSRKDIRTKLYREIRTVLKRLEDLDKLE